MAAIRNAKELHTERGIDGLARAQELASAPRRDCPSMPRKLRCNEAPRKRRALINYKWVVDTLAKDANEYQVLRNDAR